MRYAITTGSLPQAAQLAPGLFHACLTDAPYELGFMNRAWDRSGVSFSPETWSAIMERLHPGAFGLTFGGSRTYHRIATAIEDAGAIIHPTIYMWCFGSGFPKATRIDTQIDKAAGAEREQIGSGRGRVSTLDAYNEYAGDFAITRAATPDALIWEGHRYGLQAMRPAVEPVILWQKPYPKRSKPYESIRFTGAGALNIRKTMIDRGWRVDSASKRRGNAGVAYNNPQVGRDDLDRLVEGGWPCNLILVHRPDCTEARCSVDCPAYQLDEQIGLRKAGGSVSTSAGPPTAGVYSNRDRVAYQGHGDQGSSELFFHQVDWSYEVEERLGSSSLGFYSPKAKGDERDMGCEGPIVTVDDGRDKPIDNPYLRGQTERKNTHPTVKPLKACEFFARLLKPPDSYDSRLLVPFSGSGSEMIGAALAGWKEAHGIELRPEAVATALQRLAWWIQRSREALTTVPREVLKSTAPKTGGMTLLDIAAKRKG